MDETGRAARQGVQLLFAFCLSAGSALAQSPSLVDSSATPGSSESPPVSEQTPEGNPSGESAPLDSMGDASPSAAPAPAPSKEETDASSSEEFTAEGDAVPREPDPGAEPALTDTSTDVALEDQDDWLKWPFSKKNREEEQQAEPHRWASAGGFVGWVHRRGQSDSISYQPGIAWGGYLRPEITPWLGLRLFYREERIPVQVEKGAFDYGDDAYDDDFEQPDMEMLNLGARLEPTWVVHPRVRLRGAVGWSWLWYRVPFPKSDDFELKKTFRSAVQMDFSFGAGMSFDIVKNWIDISLDSSYGVPAGRTGTAYEDAQIVRDGDIHHIAPMPKLQSSLDVLISLGVIL